MQNSLSITGGMLQAILDSCEPATGRLAPGPAARRGRRTKTMAAALDLPPLQRKRGAG